MASRRNREDDDGGLDALLDTMTNVVGILVLVLIVTQMSVADVVDRIVTENKVDAEDLQEITQQLVEKKNEESDLRKVLIDPLDIDAEKQREELLKNKALLERRKKLLEEKQKQQNDFALKIESDRQQAEYNQQQIAEIEAKRKQLPTLIAKSLEQKAELQARLDQTPKVSVPVNVEVTIPNPRPAPPGSKQALVLCFDNQLYPVNMELFRKTAEQRAKAIIARYQLKPVDPSQGIDPQKFKQHYERLKDQDDFFDVEYFVHADRWPRLRLIPRQGRGASEQELVNPRSRIRTKWLSQLDVQKYYARFYVLPDSFEIYVTARRLFSQAGMLAGWAPQNQDYVLTSHITGGIELGPPRPRPPAPPVKPANVID